MEELHRVALAYYKNGSEVTKQEARDLYSDLYSKCNSHIGVDEFIAFSREVDPTFPSPRELFSRLCTINEHEKSEVLSFEQVLTFFYIVQSGGRPNCDGCGEFLITGVFFTCVECFDSSNSFDVCLDCHHAGNYQHHHARQQFLDNVALLRLYKLNTPSQSWQKWKKRLRLVKTGVGITTTVIGCSIM